MGKWADAKKKVANKVSKAKTKLAKKFGVGATPPVASPVKKEEEQELVEGIGGQIKSYYKGQFKIAKKVANAEYRATKAALRKNVDAAKKKQNLVSATKDAKDGL